MPPAIFALVILKIGSHFLPKLAWIITLLFYTLPTIMGRQAGDATPSFFFFFFFFCLTWLHTMIHMVSASQGARITGMSHEYPAGCF
jgi:hypothetical protein